MWTCTMSIDYRVTRSTKTPTHPTGVSLRIGETGEYCNVTGGLSWKGKALSEEFSDA